MLLVVQPVLGGLLVGVAQMQLIDEDAVDRRKQEVALQDVGDVVGEGHSSQLQV